MLHGDPYAIADDAENATLTTRTQDMGDMDFEDKDLDVHNFFHEDNFDYGGAKKSNRTAFVLSTCSCADACTF